MMYEEFNRIAGQTCDRKMYDAEIEPTYMTFDELEKQEIAVMYWGMKKGAYALWHKANALAKEKFFLDLMTSGLRGVGLTGRADEYDADWQKRKDLLIAEVKTMMNA